MPDQYGLTTEDYAHQLEQALERLKNEPFYSKDYPDTDASLYDENGNQP